MSLENNKFVDKFTMVAVKLGGSKTRKSNSFTFIT